MSDTVFSAMRASDAGSSTDASTTPTASHAGLIAASSARTASSFERAASRDGRRDLVTDRASEVLRGESAGEAGGAENGEGVGAIEGAHRGADSTRVEDRHETLEAKPLLGTVANIRSFVCERTVRYPSLI